MPLKTTVTPLLTWFARYGLLVLAALAAALLVVAEFSTLYEVVAITAVVPGGTSTAGAHHGYALAVVAVASLPMAYGAVVGGSRPAAIALVVLGTIALVVTLGFDLPRVGDEGLLAETYEAAEAHPRSGFWLEALGAVLLLGTAVATLLLRPGGAPASKREAPAEPVTDVDGDVATAR